MPSFGGNPRNTAPPPSRPSGAPPSHTDASSGGYARAPAPAPARSYGAPPSHTDASSGYGSAQASAYKATPSYRGQVAATYNAQPTAARTLPLLRALQALAPGNGRVQIPSAFLGSSPKQLLAQALLSQGNSKNAWDLSPAEVAHFLKTATPTLLTNLPAFATGRPGSGLSPTAGGFVPAGGKYIVNRADQGRDGLTNPGGPIVAPGSGHVISVSSDPGGFGPAYPIVHFDTGPYAGRDIYVGHTLAAPGIQPGATFKAGQVLSHTGTSGVGNATQPGWFEIGFANGGSPGPNGQPTPFTGTSTQGTGHPQLNAGGKAVAARPVAGANAVAAMLGPQAQKVIKAQAAQLKAQGKQPMGSGGGPAGVGGAAPGNNKVSVILGAPLSDSQKVFAAELVKKTGLDPGVVAAWIHSEQPPTGLAPNGPHNWLNIGSTDTKFLGGSNPAWQNPKSAADFSAKWLRGTPAPGFGTAAPGVQAIMNHAHRSAADQIAAIQQSGWASSGYPALRTVYDSLKGTVRLGTANVNIASGSSGSSSGSSSSAGSTGSSGNSGSSGPAQAPTDPNAAANAAVLASLAGNTTQVSAQDAQRQSLLQNLLSSSGKSPWDFGPRVPGLGGSSNPFALLLAQSSLQSLAGGLPLKSPFKTSSKKSKG